MRKADVQRSYHNGSRGEPMLNIKVDAWPWPNEALAKEVENETGESGFAAWCADQDEDTLQTWWDVACESNFEQATEDAGYVFGDAYGHVAHDKRRVWQAGRSGGWLYVTHLPDVDSWDAIALGKWARYARIVAGLVDDVPRLALELLAINAYAAECDARDRLDAKRETVMADAMADLLAGGAHA